MNRACAADRARARADRVQCQCVEGGGRGTVHGAFRGKRGKRGKRGASMTRMAGRRNSSIGCRSLIGRRASVYVNNTYDPVKLIVDINGQVALFRDLLIHIGQARDCPELREKIRKLRRSCVEACKHTSQLILPQLRSSVAEGIPEDNPHLVLLFFMSQLFLRELTKCHRLVQIIPMDMSGYYENRAGPSNLGNVISQILLCKQITPDFNQEELCSIAKDSQEISKILKEMQEYMPRQENNLERSVALTEDLTSQWTNKHRRNSLYKNMGLLCCVRRPNYL